MPPAGQQRGTNVGMMPDEVASMKMGGDKLASPKGVSIDADVHTVNDSKEGAPDPDKDADKSEEEANESDEDDPSYKDESSESEADLRTHESDSGNETAQPVEEVVFVDCSAKKNAVRLARNNKYKANKKLKLAYMSYHHAILPTYHVGDIIKAEQEQWICHQIHYMSELLETERLNHFNQNFRKYAKDRRGDPLTRERWVKFKSDWRKKFSAYYADEWACWGPEKLVEWRPHGV